MPEVLSEREVFVGGEELFWVRDTPCLCKPGCGNAAVYAAPAAGLRWLPRALGPGGGRAGELYAAALEADEDLREETLKLCELSGRPWREWTSFGMERDCMTWLNRVGLTGAGEWVMESSVEELRRLREVCRGGNEAMLVLLLGMVERRAAADETGRPR